MIQRHTHRTPLPEVTWREDRFANPKYVLCPAKCDPKRGCPNCFFWGTVLKDSPEAKCVHDYHIAGAITQTLRIYKCVKCGHTTDIDSSG